MTFGWVQGVRSMEVFGEIADGFLERLRSDGEVIASLTASWLMVVPVALALYCRARDIDLSGLIDATGLDAACELTARSASRNRLAASARLRSVAPSRAPSAKKTRWPLIALRVKDPRWRTHSPTTRKAANCGSLGWAVMLAN